MIPLEGAVGKTFENGDRSVVVNAIDTDPARGQPRIELTPDDLNDLLPADPVNGMVQGGPGGMMGGMGGGMGFSLEQAQASGVATLNREAAGPPTGVHAVVPAR